MPVQKSIDQFVVAMTKHTLILVLLPPSEFLNLLMGDATDMSELIGLLVQFAGLIYGIVNVAFNLFSNKKNIFRCPFFGLRYLSL